MAMRIASSPREDVVQEIIASMETWLIVRITAMNVDWFVILNAAGLMNDTFAMLAGVCLFKSLQLIY